MRRICKEQTGAEWDVCWGVPDEDMVLKEAFDVSGPFQRTDAYATFQDPIYPNETKTLRVYESDDGVIVAMAEITPSVYAAGVKK